MFIILCNNQTDVLYRKNTLYDGISDYNWQERKKLIQIVLLLKLSCIFDIKICYKQTTTNPFPILIGRNEG